VIMYTVIPWLPIKELDYAVRIALLHGIFTFCGWFAGNITNTYGMINLLTQNSQERQRLISFTPILFGFFYTIVAALLPILITATMFGRTFTGWEDPYVYRIICPVISVVCLAGVYFLSFIKENLVEQKVNRPKVDFWQSAKRVLQNKYWWITNLSGSLGNITAIWGNIIPWWLMYQMREPWLMGIIAQVTTFGWTVGHLFVPMLTKKYDSKTIYLLSRLAYLGLFFAIFLMFAIGSGTSFAMASIWIIVVLSVLLNIVQSIWGDIGSNFNGNILDYHQWKTGERADAMNGIFGWIFSPVNNVIALIAPYIYLLAGWTNDWGILWNETHFNRLFYYCFILATVGQVLSIVPWLFYDLTAARHKQCVDEIRERTRVADIAEIERQKAAGTIHNVDAETLARYGYDSEGNTVSEGGQA